MAWCLSQCWHRFMSPYSVTRPQWVNYLILTSGIMPFEIYCQGGQGSAYLANSMRLLIAWHCQEPRHRQAQQSPSQSITRHTNELADKENSVPCIGRVKTYDTPWHENPFKEQTNNSEQKLKKKKGCYNKTCRKWPLNCGVSQDRWSFMTWRINIISQRSCQVYSKS